jgi:hypothetical protein
VNEKRAAVGYAPVDTSGAGDVGVKFNPDQPRVPAGTSDGGQWTSGGGGSSSSDGVRVAQAEGSEFSPSKPGWHAYAVSDEGCSAELECPTGEIADQMSRFAVPGQDPSRPVKNGTTSLVRDPTTDLPAGYVDTFVSADGLTIVNRTQPLHIFYDGTVTRTATRNSDGSWTITTRGVGNNVIPGMNLLNKELGPGIFKDLDRRLRENIERHHGVRKSLSGIATQCSWLAGARDADWSALDEQ